MMDKFTTRPNFELISEEYHTDFEKSVQRRLGSIWEEGNRIIQVQTFCNNEYVFATILWSVE